MHNDLTLKQLEVLRDKGVLSDVEFASKKVEFIRSINSSHEAKTPGAMSQFMGVIGLVVLGVIGFFLVLRYLHY